MYTVQYECTLYSTVQYLGEEVARAEAETALDLVVLGRDQPGQLSALGADVPGPGPAHVR